MSNIPDVWTISGNVSEIDGVTPFSSGLIKAYDIYNGAEHNLGSANINNGSFSIMFSRNDFQYLESEHTAPNVILRVYDYPGRQLCHSEVFVPNEFYSVNLVLNRMPVPEVWNVRGTAFYQNETNVFTQGLINIYCFHNGERCKLLDTGFGNDGCFTLTFSRYQFQFGDIEKSAPIVYFDICNYQEDVLWEYGPITISSSEYIINPIIGDGILPVYPEIPDNWSVSGAVSGGNLQSLQSLIVDIYDCDLDLSHETYIGTARTNSDGTYHFEYTIDKFQYSNPMRNSPNLFIRVYSADRLNFLDSSDILYNAPVNAEINMVIGLEPEVPIPNDSEDWEVSGFIRDSQGYLVTMGIVRVYDIYNCIRTELCSAVLDGSGCYRMIFSKEDFQQGNESRTAPNLKVCLFYPQNILLSKSSTIFNASHNQTIDLTVNIGNDSDSESEYCVYGHITNKADLSVAHHLVNAYALRIAEDGKFAETLLGSTPTDVNGHYEIGYNPELLEFPILKDPDTHGASTVSLFIRLPGEAGVADISPIVCHSAKRQQIDLQVNRTSGSDSSEYEFVRSALFAYLPAMEFNLSEEEPKFSNCMQYISCKTGVEEDKVSCFYYSEHFSERLKKALGITNVDPENLEQEGQEAAVPVLVLNLYCDFEKFMYAAFRSGYPSNDVYAICKVNPNDHYNALTEAIKNRVISESTTLNLPVFWDQWLDIVRILTASISTQNAVTASMGVFARTILEAGKVLPLSTNESLQIQRIVEKVIKIYQDAQGDMSLFWNEMNIIVDSGDTEYEGITELFVKQLIFINDLYSISNGFLPFAQGAYLHFTGRTSYYESEIETYNICNLASFNKGQWEGMTYEFTKFTNGIFPDILIGTTNSEKAAILALTTRKLYEEKFPIANVAAEYAQSEDDNLITISEFLNSAAAEGFDLDSTNIDTYEQLPEGVDKDVLKALQRINRLTENPEAQIYLLRNGYDSAYTISSYEEEKFIVDNFRGLGGMEEARQIHRLAVMYATEMLNLIGQYHDSISFSDASSPDTVSVSEQTVSVSSASAALSKTAKAITPAVTSTVASSSSLSPSLSSWKNPSPTYKTLFGTLSEIRFKNAQSIFGASAYFVDLLEFIDGLNRSNLFSRRPELKETELTDGNAETVLPYIDIAIEILENAISPRWFFLNDSTHEIKNFLDVSLNSSTTIPSSLESNLTRRGIDVSGNFKVRVNSTEANAYYLTTGSWRILFSHKLNPGLSVEGYLITMYPQTSKSSADLAIMPEHRNPLTYEVLSKLYFPLQFPLNPGADEVQETMRLLGVSKLDSIIALRREFNSRYDDKINNGDSLICANLGINNKIKDLLESTALPSNVNSWELWGLQENSEYGSWKSVMSSVPEFMHRTRLDVEGMLDIFALKTLNEDGHIELRETTESRGKGEQTGDPDYFEIKNLTELDLTKIHRLIRLRNILQCSWKELDCFLLSACDGEIHSSLRKIHVSRIFMSRHSIGFADTGCFWGQIIVSVNNRFGKSPFEERFLSKKLSDDTVSSFKVLLNSSDAEEESVQVPRQALQQALQLSEKDLERIIEKESVNEFSIDIDAVSTILRVTLLTKALNLSVDDFYALKFLTGIDPFCKDDPEKLLLFDDECSRLSEHGIKATAVKKFIEGEPQDNKDQEWVRDAFSSLREIAEANYEIPEDRADSKEDYYETYIYPQVESFLLDLFSQFTGGDYKLADKLLGESGKQAWKNVATVGWTVSLDGEERGIAYDFSLPQGTKSYSEIIWSAIIITKSNNIEFTLEANACTATLEPVILYSFDNEETVVMQIDITATKFKFLEENDSDNSIKKEDYYLDLRCNSNSILFSDLIPKSKWVDIDILQSALPRFRKMQEYLELTGIDSTLYRKIIKKQNNQEWKILLSKDFLQWKEDSQAWDKFMRLLDIKTLFTTFPIGENSFWDVIKALEKAENALACLSEMQNKWDGSKLIDMVNISTPLISSSNAESIASPKMLTYILKNMPVVEKIGVPVEKLVAIHNNNPEETEVKTFRLALQKHLGMDSWNEMVKSMMNAMRIRQRDAMTEFLTYSGPCINLSDSGENNSYTAYLRKVLANAGVLENECGSHADVQNALNLYKELTGAIKDPIDWKVGPEQWAVLDGRKGYSNSNDIYANFLIDTEMNTDMITSRIVQGSAAVQLFVQRILMGLESSSRLDESEISQWTWVKNYRVWEANRKVFLYPENWIEPELRDDKTPFFKELEAEFEDGDITSSSAENAFCNYLEKIRTVAGLDIVGVYRGDSDLPNGKDTLHIIGKTKALPHSYYYRRCYRKNNLANVWTPWETIDIDMQGNSVLPIMFNGHLYVFWALFKPTNEPDDKGNESDEDSSCFIQRDTKGNDVEIPMPQNTVVVDISLFWSTLADGKWTEKKQTPSFIDANNDFYMVQDPELNVADRYHFRIKETSAEYVKIEVCKTYEETIITYKNKLYKKGEVKFLLFAKLLRKKAKVETVTKIRTAGIYTVWHDGNVSFEKINDEYERDFRSDPKDTLFTENHTTSSKSQSVIRSDEIKLMDRSSGGYKFLTANSGQFTGDTSEPGFFIEESKTYLVQRSDNGKTAPTYKMEPVSHPIVKEFQRRFEEGGLKSLMRRETQALAIATGKYYNYSYYSYNYYYNVLLGYYIAGDWQAWDAGQNAFELRYLPNKSVLSRPFPMDVVDFNYGTPNGIYNWELFFHVPFLIARQLSVNQRYEESLEWYHLIFDPRNKLSNYEKTKRWALKLPAGACFWNFLPFFANADADKTIMETMGLPDSYSNTPKNEALKTLVDDWKNDPFNPHLIARNRIVAYQKSVVMHYLDTLVAWADQKFRQDTLESINEAIQLYILAAEILGSRPQSIPFASEVSPLSYTEAKKANMDSFSNVVVQLENSRITPIDNAKNTTQGSVTKSTNQALGLGPKMYYFTVPRNEKLMSYWDLLDDRLFKIRNGMNIEGVKRQLSLFAPPIDPGMLVKAAAAGIDIGTALNDMFAPVPKYRFTFMVQKAIDLCNIVQSMGGAVLSALEKKDSEEITRLRAEHENTLHSLSKEVRKMQIEEASIAIEGLEKTKESTLLRKEHYEKLISEGISKLEQEQLNQMLSAATDSEKAHNIRQSLLAASIAPDINVGASGVGGSPHFTTSFKPLEMLKLIASIRAAGLEFKSGQKQGIASRGGINAGYERREQDWKFQQAIAEKDLENIELQILGAQIRKQVAEKELSNLEKQIEQSKEVYEFLKSKFTNKDLYQWMIKEISLLYSKIYQLAYDTAKRAEKSYRFELGISDASSFIQFGYWDGLYKGLLAGELLMLDLRRMEMSYVEKNGRELEITKPISIAQIDPQAILDLQANGTCEFSLPEYLFDLDFPGHYFRRIRSVRLTIPCVTGPYTSVSAKLTLLKNSMRKTSQLNPSYPRGNDNSEQRFTDQCVGIQSIATSQPDGATGMFDFNFRDERYLPFEGAGVISDWRLELPRQLRQFNYNSISDIVLHISYTAREDGVLKNAAESWLYNKAIALLSEDSRPLNLVLSLKRDFPDAWQSLLDGKQAKIAVTPEHYPYFLRDRNIIVTGYEWLYLSKANPISEALPSTTSNIDSAFFEYTLNIKPNDKEDDILLKITYSVDNKGS